MRFLFFLFLILTQSAVSQSGGYGYGFKNVKEAMEHLEEEEKELMFECAKAFGIPVDSMLGMDDAWYSENSDILNDCRAKLVTVNNCQHFGNELPSTKKILVKEFGGKRTLSPPRFLFFISKNNQGTEVSVQMFY